MCATRCLLLLAVVLLLAGATAEARVSHGYSSIFSLDTVGTVVVASAIAR